MSASLNFAAHTAANSTAAAAHNSARSHTAAAAPAANAALSSDSLLQGHKSVEIVHRGAVYRLQATKLGKLILTK